MKKNASLYFYLVIAVLILLVAIPSSRKLIRGALLTSTKPVISFFSKTAFGMRGIISAVSEISSLRQENEELAQKLKNMQVDSTELDELRHENEILKNQLGFLDQHKENNLVPARIIGREPIGTLDKITIDKGAKDGVTINSAVVSDGCLVGRVSEVNDSLATVTLITSKDSIVQAMLENSRTLGILKGSLQGVKLENIPQDTQVGEKEAIVTSGLGGEIAPGILIGWSHGVTSNQSEIYKILDVDLAEDLHKLEFVFVVK